MRFLGVMFAPTGFHQFWWKFDENAFPPHTIGCFENNRELSGSGEAHSPFREISRFFEKPCWKHWFKNFMRCFIWVLNFSYGFLFFSYVLWTLSNISCDNIKRNITGFYFFTSCAFLLFFSEETTISQSKK